MFLKTFCTPNTRSCTEFFSHKKLYVLNHAGGTRTCSLPGPDAMDQTSHACNVILHYAGHVREDHKPSVNDVRSGRSGGGFAGVLVGANCFREEGPSFTCRVHRTR